MNRLRQELAREPGGEFLIASDRVWTRAEVLAAAGDLAAHIPPRGRMLLQTADPAALLVALVACQDADADLVLAHAHLKPEQLDPVRQALRVDGELLPEGDRLACALAPGAAADRPGTGTVFLMTSGTTGAPKVVEHRFDRLADRILSSARVAANRGARWLLTYQPTAFAGLQVSLAAALLDGTLVTASAGTPGALAAALRRHGPTHVSGTPTFWRALLLTCEPTALATLRQITLGGEAADQATLDRLARACPAARITHIYASTEAGALFSVTDGRAGFPAAWLGQEVQGVRLRVCDGQLEVLSPRGMIGYRHTEAAGPGPLTEDGWLRTGDLVRVEGDRVLFLGRRDALINVGGYKVFPQEVEAFLLGLPEVAEARIKAVRNPITGQALVAEVVPTPGIDPDAARRSILQACRQHLPRQQVPALVEIVSAVAVAESTKKRAASA